MESMKKISLIALACTFVYTGCLVDSKADIDSKIDDLKLNTQLKTQLDTLSGNLSSANTQSTRCNVVGDLSNTGTDERFYLGDFPESNLKSHYNFRVNLSDSISSVDDKSNIHSLLDSLNFGLRMYVDSSYTVAPQKILVEYKRVNSSVFSGDTFSVDSLNSEALNFFSAPKTWTDSLESNSPYSNSFTTTTTLETARLDATEESSTVPSSFKINFSSELIQELQSKKTETLIYDFRISSLDDTPSHWLFSKNSQNYAPVLTLEDVNRKLIHHAECVTNENDKPFLTSLTNDTLSLKFEIDQEVTSNNLIRRAWLVLDSSTYASAVEDSIVKSSNFYNTSRIYSDDTLQFQESSLDTLSQSRYDLVSDMGNISLPITSVVDHSVVDTNTTMTKEIRFALSTSSIDTKYYYNTLAWFELNSETVPVKIVIESLIEEIE